MATAQQIPDILSAEFAENPYPAYRAMRESAPLLWHEATRSYLFSRYDDVEPAGAQSADRSGEGSRRQPVQVVGCLRQPAQGGLAGGAGQGGTLLARGDLGDEHP
jgi:cytochrome P450